MLRSSTTAWGAWGGRDAADPVGIATGDTTGLLKCGSTPLTNPLAPDDSRWYGLNFKSVRWCAADTDGIPAAFKGPATLAPGGDSPGCQNCNKNTVINSYEWHIVHASRRT